MKTELLIIFGDQFNHITICATVLSCCRQLCVQISLVTLELLLCVRFAVSSRVLLQAGANVNAQGNVGATALYVAVDLWEMAAVEYLLKVSMNMEVKLALKTVLDNPQLVPKWHCDFFTRFQSKQLGIMVKNKLQMMAFA